MSQEIKIRAIVFASLQPGTIDIHVGYGYGLTDGGSLWRVNRAMVPENCRMPNTYVWVSIVDGKVTSIERMTREEFKENRMG